jgi:hypothetical protein
MARGRTTALTISLTPEERQTLLAWQRSTTIRAGLRRRTPQYTHENTRMVMGGHPEAAWGTIQELVRQPHMVLKQLACYDYQTCERPDYEMRVAYRYVTQLKAAVLKTFGRTEQANVKFHRLTKSSIKTSNQAFF